MHGSKNRPDRPVEPDRDPSVYEKWTTIPRAPLTLLLNNKGPLTASDVAFVASHALCRQNLSRRQERRRALSSSVVWSQVVHKMQSDGKTKREGWKTELPSTGLGTLVLENMRGEKKRCGLARQMLWYNLHCWK
ncbi:hypothetical protein PIB30_062935 [Stylosanthes scabra]|uniref:Uncharacterized protein n=1 Tax=Stylosanthes scabra TaxID=79078 RepID=A0ABU6ZK14_9FABA|nr:hypothetical protein [Stylosanthes scabra]